MAITNPLIGKQMKTVVRTQINNNDPAIAKQTYERLLADGHNEKEVIRMMACVLIAEMADMVKEMREFDLEKYTTMLNDLPTEPE